LHGVASLVNQYVRKLAGGKAELMIVFGQVHGLYPRLFVRSQRFSTPGRINADGDETANSNGTLEQEALGIKRNHMG